MTSFPNDKPIETNVDPSPKLQVKVTKPASPVKIIAEDALQTQKTSQKGETERLPEKFQISKDFKENSSEEQKKILSSCQKTYEAALVKNKDEVPTIYFNEAYQAKVAKDLGIYPARIKAPLLKQVKSRLDIVVKNTAPPVPLKGISMTPVLQELNFKMRQLEARLLEVIKLDEDPENAPIKKELLDENLSIRKEYDSILHAKIAHVRTAYPDNPVYAMGIPQVLTKGTKYFTAGDDKKMMRILYHQGFTAHKDSAATQYAKNFKAIGTWGTNEMGEKGHYFAKDTPAYIAMSGLALECELKENMNGVSIISTTKLIENFTGDEVDKGYAKLQETYSFLQHGGLYPLETEVVFLRTDNKLEPKQFVTGEDETDTKPLSFNEYFKSHPEDIFFKTIDSNYTIGKPLPKFHQTWQTPEIKENTPTSSRNIEPQKIFPEPPSQIV